MIAVVISLVFTAFDPKAISPVRVPSVTVFLMAVSIRVATVSSPKLKRSIRAAERIWADGLAIPLPAISGAVPPAGYGYGVPVDVDDSDPVFDDLEYYRPAAFRRRAG